MFFISNPLLFKLPWRLSWMGLLGIVMLFLTTGVRLFVLSELIENNNALEIQITKQHALLKTLTGHVKNENTSDLPAHLAKFERLATIVGDLQSQAQMNGLTLSDVTYQPDHHPNKAEIGNVTILAHFKGSYGGLKKCLSTILVAHEGFGLNSISIQRNRASDVINEMEGRMTFYYRQ